MPNYNLKYYKYLTITIQLYYHIYSQPGLLISYGNKIFYIPDHWLDDIYFDFSLTIFDPLPFLSLIENGSD
ncbi:MAG: hypothetical protein CMG41_01895 [Candidatus Marinimicrobia bacterium]|nr:hypothetical protein [Candidatus Neomarinimicrobiota bacterium]